MSNIQKTLDNLQPYVIGIRYLEGTALVDVVFKDGWNVQEQSNLKVVKGDEGMNYYMIFSEVKGIGLDDLLDFVGKTIKLNLDREKKHDLLRVKVNELKEIFKKNTLLKLNRLKFTFDDEDLTPNIDEFDIEDFEIEEIQQIQSNNIENSDVSIDTLEPIVENVGFLDEHGHPIEMTEEDIEILEEEARAKRNLEILNNKKQVPTQQRYSNKIELPPKRKVTTEQNATSSCDCGEDEACHLCIDKK